MKRALVFAIASIALGLLIRKLARDFEDEELTTLTASIQAATGADRNTAKTYIYDHYRGG